MSARVCLCRYSGPSGLGVSGGRSWAVSSADVTAVFQGGLLSMLISLGLMMWLSVTPHNSETEKKRLLILSTFAFFTGTGLGPLMDLVISINPTIIPTAFLISALVFCCFTLSALYAQRRSYLFLGGILMSLLTVLCLLPLVNLIFGSVLLVKAQLYTGLLVFCGFILFDTQLIIEKAENGDKDYIW
ncbi:probable Bax inhibitor 1 [Rhincodon typus]|uniref:probable Bax inhibitor 1 n=1 Tax=Rhincodon typus TaxID=259920 RepID=UPI0020304A79|nr:probable Bax inhibitor 1 [Rhincodon typus]